MLWAPLKVDTFLSQNIFKILAKYRLKWKNKSQYLSNHLNLILNWQKGFVSKSYIFNICFAFLIDFIALN